MHEVIAEDGSRRQHRRWLRDLLEKTEGSVRIASAYVTDRTLLSGLGSRTVQILTFLSRMDIISGATSLECLSALTKMGASCSYLSDGPRLHGKVYIFGEQFAFVTSANLTSSALDSNIEVGVQVTGEAVKELIDWFNAFWRKAKLLDVAQVAKWQAEIGPLRGDYADLRRKAADALLTLPSEILPSSESLEKLGDLLDNASRFFFCNTNRKDGTRTLTGGYFLEEEMHRRHCAAAWKPFRQPSHVKKVESGDAIFMFAKGVGIIGIGRAKAKCEVLGPSDSNRIWEGSEKEEWRVPVDWLGWRCEDAFSLKGQDPPLPSAAAFCHLTDAKYAGLRDAVKRHFLGGEVGRTRPSQTF